MNDTGFATVSDEVTATDLEFSTLPENIWVLLAVLPFFPQILKRLKKARKNF